MMVGFWSSVIVTVKEQGAVLPEVSAFVQLTVVTPVGKVEPEAGVQVAEKPVQLSLALRVQVTLALPQDVQVEVFDYPEEFFEKRVWIVARPRADVEVIHTAAEWIGSAQKPLIIAITGFGKSSIASKMRRLFIASR